MEGRKTGVSKLIDADAVLNEIDKMPTVIDTSGAKFIEKTCLKIRIKALTSAKPVWIMASEKLPEEEGLYLVAGDFPPGAEVHIRYFNVLHDRSVWSGTMTDKVKWWMPIPKQPEGAQDEN